MKRIWIVGGLALVVVALVAATAITAVGGVRAARAGALGQAATEARRGEGGGGQRGARGEGAGRATEDRARPAAATEEHAWETVMGTVETDTTADGADVTVRTVDNTLITVGVGPGWLATQGWVLAAGDVVEVRGFWEDGEFKAAEITRMGDGSTIVLRAPDGRPSWAGQGRGQNRQATGSGEAFVTGGGRGRNR